MPLTAIVRISCTPVNIGGILVAGLPIRVHFIFESGEDSVIEN